MSASSEIRSGGRHLANVGHTIHAGWVRLSLRARLLASVLVLVALGLVVSDVAGAFALRSYLVGRVDSGLMNAEQPAARLLDNGGLFGERELSSILGDTDGYAALVSQSGQVLRSTVVHPITQVTPSPPQLGTDIGASGSALVTLPAQHSGSASWRVTAYPVSVAGENATLVIGASLAPVQSTLNRLELIEILVSLGVLLLIGIVGRWLVHLGLRPLDKIGDTAGAIAAGDLSQRIERQDSETEVGRLGLALNTMMGQIEAAFVAGQASEDRLRRFVADASHELRTPLTSIRGYAELFRRGAWARPDDLRTAMRRIEEESIRMGGLVEDMLLLARLDQHRPLESSEVDLAVIAADAVADARATDPQRPISLRIGGPVPVLGDEARLRQVAANLLANARDHTPPGTAVLVSAGVERAPAAPVGAMPPPGEGFRSANGSHTSEGFRTVSGSDTADELRSEEGAGTDEARASGESVPEWIAVLEIADRGPGLAPETASRVFERFYRVDSSRSRGSLGTGGGSGLGLSIVAAIAEAHGGQVSVRSAPGEGAVFRVEIPLEPGSSPVAQIGPGPEPIPTNGLRAGRRAEKHSV